MSYYLPLPHKLLQPDQNTWSTSRLQRCWCDSESCWPLCQEAPSLGESPAGLCPGPAAGLLSWSGQLEVEEATETNGIGKFSRYCKNHWIRKEATANVISLIHTLIMMVSIVHIVIWTYTHLQLGSISCVHWEWRYINSYDQWYATPIEEEFSRYGEMHITATGNHFSFRLHV